MAMSSSSSSGVSTAIDSLSSLSYSDKIIQLGDGWCSFPDLDNFDSDKLLRALTLKEKDSSDSIWNPALSYSTESIGYQSAQSHHRGNELSISGLRQLEALFNLAQLLFGLSRAETVNYTFRDLQMQGHPHSFRKSGFKQFNSSDYKIYFIYLGISYMHNLDRLLFFSKS
jgi:hypothetical protein